MGRTALGQIYQFLIYHVLSMPHALPVDRHLPLSPAVFHLLLALADGDRHGYAIMRDIDEGTGGVVRVGPGMLYGSIKWLREDGLIEEVSARQPGLPDERRRYYRLTADGRTVLRAEASRLEAAVGLARRRRVLSRKA